MATHLLRRQIRQSLRECAEKVQALRNDLDVAFEVEKLGWINTSPLRRRKEDNVEDQLIAIDRALTEINNAVAALRVAGERSDA